MIIRIYSEDIVVLKFETKMRRYKKYKIGKRANKTNFEWKIISLTRKKLWSSIKRLQELLEQQALMICNGRYTTSEYNILLGDIDYKESQVEKIYKILKKWEEI